MLSSDPAPFYYGSWLDPLPALTNTLSGTVPPERHCTFSCHPLLALAFSLCPRGWALRLFTSGHATFSSASLSLSLRPASAGPHGLRGCSPCVAQRLSPISAWRCFRLWLSSPPVGVPLQLGLLGCGSKSSFCPAGLPNLSWGCSHLWQLIYLNR